MGEDSNTPMNVYVSKDGQSVLFGKADSIEITEESVCPVQGTIKGNEVELMNLSYLGTTSSLTIDMELDEFNADLLLEVCTPQMREVDYRFVLGTLSENEFSWDYGGADDLIELLSLLLRGQKCRHKDTFLFYWVLGNYYELKVELLDGSDYHAHDGLKSISLDGHVVTPTALMLFRVVNFLCMYEADTELVLDGARVRLRVSRIGSNENNESDKENK